MKKKIILLLLTMISIKLSAQPTLGTYPATTITHAGGNISVTPSAAPSNNTAITVYTDARFKGSLFADSATGVVFITNAHPAGIYTVTVKAFGTGSAIQNFSLTVNNPAPSESNFALGSDFTFGSLPFYLAVSDFNRDGKQDIVSANYWDNNISLRLGDGAGGFGGGSDINVGALPRDLGVGDFNGDGYEDVAVSNIGSCNGCPPRGIHVKFGDGSGGFSGGTFVSAGSSPRSIAVGEFNGDGIADIAAVSGNTLYIRLGDGSGDFTSSPDVIAGTSPEGIAIGEFNGDGFQDILIANTNSGTVSLKLGDGSGGFSAGSDINVGGGPVSVAVGDFDGDGKRDFAAANHYFETVSIVLGNGAGGFSGVNYVSVGSFPSDPNPRELVIGDFNGDGNQDFATAGRRIFSNGVEIGGISIRLGDGTGGFSGRLIDFIGSNSLVVGDFNQDGFLDIATQRSNGTTNNYFVSVLQGDTMCIPMQITTTLLADAELGSPFSQNLSAITVNGIPNYSWSVLAGTLPEGVTLSASGVLSGTPTEAGEFHFTVQVTDGDCPYISTDEKDLVLKVSLTLPEPQFTIFKSGTSAVPGREMDYFITVENVGSVTATVFVTELLEPWFTYIVSSPSAEVFSNIPDYFTTDSTDSIPSIIRWEILLAPGESKVISYKVLLQSVLPAGVTVNGCACLTPLEKNKCQAQYLLCLGGAIGGCGGIATLCTPVAAPLCFISCAAPLITACLQLYDDCLQEEASDPNQGECACTGITVQVPIDPNEKLVLAPHYIKPDALLPYVIHFENIGTIEAQDVFLTDTLDADLDYSTLNILSPAGSSFDSTSGRLRWNLLDINLMPDSSAYVLYRAKPKPGLPSGTVIKNKAHIQFEVFDVFATNETENIIDGTIPVGTMTPLPAVTYQTAFPISWSGVDSVGEIKEYSIFVSIDSGGYSKFITTKDTFAIYTGETGKTYHFICIAEDLAGNVEVQAPVAETSTTLDVLCTTVYYYDADNDGYGNIRLPSTSCTQPAGFVPDSTDCNDANAAIHPGAPEICNFIDDDCDGQIDDGVNLTVYRDEDNDGYGNPLSSAVVCTMPSSGYTLDNTDCNDADSTVHPELAELCNGKDDNCNGKVDEGCNGCIMTVNAGADESTFFGYSADQTVTHTAVVSGGTAPYSYSWTINRLLHCNQVSNSGDEIFTRGSCTNTVCPSSGQLSINPVCTGSASITVMLMDTTDVCITVTDANNCIATDCFTVNALDARCFAGKSNNDKVIVCHYTGNSSNPWVQICVANEAVSTHLANNERDYVGSCRYARIGNDPDEAISLGLELYPNPAKDALHVSFNTINSQPYDIKLYDLVGKVVSEWLGMTASGTNVIELNIESINAGIYFFSITTGTEQQTQKLVVE